VAITSSPVVPSSVSFVGLRTIVATWPLQRNLGDHLPLGLRVEAWQVHLGRGQHVTPGEEITRVDVLAESASARVSTTKRGEIQPPR
jgi:hypothetical protein